MSEKEVILRSMARGIHRSHCTDVKPSRCEYNTEDYEVAERLLQNLIDGKFDVEYGTKWHDHETIAGETRAYALHKEATYGHAKAVMHVITPWMYVNE